MHRWRGAAKSEKKHLKNVQIHYALSKSTHARKAGEELRRWESGAGSEGGTTRTPNGVAVGVCKRCIVRHLANIESPSELRGRTIMHQVQVGATSSRVDGISTLSKQSIRLAIRCLLIAFALAPFVTILSKWLLLCRFSHRRQPPPATPCPHLCVKEVVIVLDMHFQVGGSLRWFSIYFSHERQCLLLHFVCFMQGFTGFVHKNIDTCWSHLYLNCSARCWRVLQWDFTCFYPYASKCD